MEGDLRLVLEFVSLIGFRDLIPMDRMAEHGFGRVGLNHTLGRP
jgi:hypothetical protein